MIKEIPAKTVYICDRCEVEYKSTDEGIDLNMFRTGGTLYRTLNFCESCANGFYAWKYNPPTPVAQ